jgi:hypothetical protein
VLQGNIKRDPEGYADEFQLQVSMHACLSELRSAPAKLSCVHASARDACVGVQLRHYRACLDIFNMKPSKESREFAELVGFIAQARAPDCWACSLHPQGGLDSFSGGETWFLTSELRVCSA